MNSKSKVLAEELERVNQGSLLNLLESNQSLSKPRGLKPGERKYIINIKAVRLVLFVFKVETIYGRDKFKGSISK